MLDSAHSTYLQTAVKLLRQLAAHDPAAAERIYQLHDEILVVLMLDLEPAQELLLAGYCPRLGGKNPREPVAMFRSLILMLLLGKPSYNKWVAQLKGHPELRILSGFFRPETPSELLSVLEGEQRRELPFELAAMLDCPGVGTFYDFASRLQNGPYQKPCEHLVRPSERFKGSRGRFRRDLPEEKQIRNELQQQQLAEKNERKVQQMVRVAMSRAEDKLPEDFLHRIEELLMLCAVVPSARDGLLGDLSKLAVSGDGSGVATQASGRGKRMCNCREQQVYDCDCSKTYSDPEATWGWDSYRKKNFFGHRLHLMQLIVDGVDLPLHLMIEAGHVADVVMGVTSLERLHKLLRQHLPEARLEFLLYDKGYDAEHFYRYINKLGGKALIPMVERGKTPVDENNIPRDKNGIPLCPGKIPMKRMGCNYQRGHTRYCCPVKYIGREKRTELERCPLGVLCEPDSKMGPLVYLSFDENPRLNTAIPRGSESFKELYKQRSSPERFYSTLASAGLKSRPYRRQHLYLLGALCHAIGVHARAWVKKRFGSKKAKDAHQLLDWAESLLKLE
ncbi:MAG TPA: hypothetical protein QF753_22805 [Victivallales bacterium]|nr:hypothetical protein [Victivallales bacterium]